MLDKEVLGKLNQPLDQSRIKTRQGGGGMQLAYIKGHDAIDTANQIFGFGNWGFDLLSNELINVLGESGEILGGYYAARVKLTISGCVPITEEGVCPIQEGRNPRARIDAHDMARKGAITDALKRALRCYGDQFGNSLYDNEPGSDAYQATHKDQRPPQPAQAASQPTQRTQQVPTVQHTPITQQQQARPVTPPTPIQAQPQEEKITQKGIDSIVTLAGNKGLDEIALATKSIKLYKKPLPELTLTEGQAFYRELLKV